VPHSVHVFVPGSTVLANPKSHTCRHLRVAQQHTGECRRSALAADYNLGKLSARAAA
jgi:hypothetical protein